MGILTVIANGLRFFAELTGLISKRSDLNNTPEMKRADEAQKATNQSDENSRIIKDRDLEALRRKHSV